MCASPEKFNKVLFHKDLAISYLKQYAKLFNWSPGMKMVDIGTGPGHVLFEVEEMLPKNYKEIVGTDVSQVMVDYFNSLPKDSRISCRQFDIGSPDVPHDLNERFDFAFSSFCFQFLPNTRQVFKNSRQMLKPNGELYTAFAKRCFYNDIYKQLSEIPKWAPYVSDYKNWRNYFDTDNSMATLENLMNDVGFKILKAEDVKDNVFEDDAQLFIDLFDSMDMVSQRVPEYDLPKFREEYTRLTRKVLEINEDTKRAKLVCPCVTLAARKI